jgi:folate-binding protein YgfZ
MDVYTAIESEYQAAQNGVVRFRSGLGVVRATGSDRLDFLNRMSTAPVGDLKSGQDAHTVITNEKGRIIDVVRLVELGDFALMISQSPDTEPVRTWLEKYTIMDDFATEDCSAAYENLYVTGHGLTNVLRELFDVSAPPRGSVATGQVDGKDWYLMRDDGLVDPEGALILVESDAALALNDRLDHAGVSEISHGTYEVLRIAAGRPSYGKELGSEFNPLEAGLSSYVSFTKGCFVGQEVIARLDSYDKVKRHLMGVRCNTESLGVKDGAPDEFLVRDGDDSDTIGVVRSAAKRPDGDLIGLAYIRTMFANAGDSVFLRLGEGEGGGERIPGTLTHLPFNTD